MSALNTVCLCLGYLSLSFACAIAIAYCAAGCVNGWRRWRAETGRAAWDAHTAAGLAAANDEPDPGTVVADFDIWADELLRKKDA